ncbi:homeobox protein notochord [Erethizon dorsatum]
MPSPGPRDRGLPAPPAPPRRASSFSVDAILARPGPRARAASPPPVPACAAAPGLWSAACWCPGPALPWACAASWPPAPLSVGPHARLQQPAVPRLLAAPFGGLAGVGVTVETEARSRCGGSRREAGEQGASAGAAGGLRPARVSASPAPFLPTPSLRLGMEDKLYIVILFKFHPSWELAHCSGLWAPPDWAPPEDLQDTERHQKRVRTMFNLEQLEELEKVFAKQHNLVGKKRAQLAARLQLTENQVRIWFQNRRVKYQKQQKLKLPALSAVAASPDEPSSSSDSSIQSEGAESGADS